MVAGLENPVVAEITNRRGYKVQIIAVYPMNLAPAVMITELSGQNL